MDKAQCITVVPAYRAPKDDFESKSFERTCQCFHNGMFDALCIVTHKGVDLSEYHKIASHCGVEFQVKNYSPRRFKNIHGYNTLMLDPQFYRDFRNYEYMLICQLDAMILGDNLTSWTEKGYDYIGGPIFAPGHYDSTDLAAVGNGGFCLRKVSSSIQALGGDGPLEWKSILGIKRQQNPKFSTRKKILYTIMVASAGRFNRFVNLLSHWVMEDLYFTYALQGTPWQLNVPTALEASKFAMDLGPDFWYKANGGTLPFGAHKYGAYYPGFYKNFFSKQ